MKETWNPAEISEDIKPVNYVNADTWNAAELNEAINLFGIKYPVDTWNPAELDEKARNIINDITSTKNITGNPISFKTINGGYAKSCEVTMNPIQDLHGYDHPWAGGNEKNKFNGLFPSISSVAQYIELDVGDGSFTMSTTCPKNENNASNLFFTNSTSAPSTDENGVWQGQTRTVTSVNGKVYVWYRKTPQINPENYNTQVEFGNIATDYAPYSNICPISGRDSLHLYQDTEQTETPETTHTATFSDTVYGGSYDFVSGKLVIKYGFVDLGTLNWELNATSKFVTSSSIGTNQLPNQTTLANILCSNYPTVTQAKISSNDKAICGLNWGGGRVLIYDTSYTDATTFKNAMSGVQLCYELETPIDITLTPEDIELLKGNNTLWTDGDNITLKYTKLALPDDSDGLSLNQKVRKAIEIIKGKAINEELKKEETKKSTTKGRRKKS